MTVNWVGSGLLTTPSGITVPAITAENNMLAASMSLSVNGVDYVSTKRIQSGSVGWKNNLLLNAGFYPGSAMGAPSMADLMNLPTLSHTLGGQATGAASAPGGIAGIFSKNSLSALKGTVWNQKAWDSCTPKSNRGAAPAKHR